MIIRTSLAALGLVGVLALSACGPAEPSKAPGTPVAAAPVKPPAQEQASAPTTEAPLPLPGGINIEARYTPHFKQCLETGDAAQGVTSAMVECVSAELALQDGALNAEYARVQQAMPPAEFEAVRQAQRQWIKDRDAKCRAAATTGGTLDRILGPSCLLDETIRRTIALEEIAAEGGR